MSVWIQHIGWMVMSQAGEPAAETLETASATEVQSVWDFVLKGGVMMIPIGLCSLIALTVFTERLILSSLPLTPSLTNSIDSA